MAGMLIQCANCGYGYSFKFGKAAEEIEAQMNDFICAGWRWATDRSGYICPECQNGTRDPFYDDGFYRTYAGKAKLTTKTRSYAVLLQDIMCQLQCFSDLGG